MVGFVVNVETFPKTVGLVKTVDDRRAGKHLKNNITHKRFGKRTVYTGNDQKLNARTVGVGKHVVNVHPINPIMIVDFLNRGFGKHEEFGQLVDERFQR